MSKMTLPGMYQHDNTLFDDIVLPSGIDKDLCIDSILLRAGEFEVLYSDYDFLKSYLTHLTKKWNRTFTKWYEALNISYSPLENYDRQESWSDNATGSATSSTSANQGNSQTDNEYVTSYDTDSLHRNNENTSSSSMNESTSGNSSNKADSSHSGRTHGNIGVTTSQQMLQAELDIDLWNLYDHIADVIVQECCIMVY